MNRALFLAALLLAGCPSPGAQTGGASASTTAGPGIPKLAPGHRPRLVVVVVIDQLPEWSFEQKLPALGNGGFARLLGEGEWHVGHHPSAATLTAPGHTLLGTGKPPAYSGILGNEWWSRDEQRVVHAVEPDDTTKFLRVPGLGDAIARAHTGAKAVAVSLKDRASRLPLGKHGLAIWYDAKTARWTGNGDALGHTIAGPAAEGSTTPIHGVTTSPNAATASAGAAPNATATNTPGAATDAPGAATNTPGAATTTTTTPATNTPGAATTTPGAATTTPTTPAAATSPAAPASHASAPPPLPAWVIKLPAVTSRITTWTPLDADKLARLSGLPDAQPGEVGEKGFGAMFPHDPAKTPSPRDAVFAMPLGNEIVLDTALAAIAGEGLGKDDKPDLLFVSLSAHDYIAHGWGHESWEAWDCILRLDGQLAHFVDELDRRVGANNWSMIVTSDHGGAHLPELTGGGRISFEQLLSAANNAATAELGPGTWVSNAHYPYVFLSKATLAQPKREIAIVIKKIEYALRSFPGIARAGRVDTYAGHCESRSGDDKALCLTFDPQRAGEIFYMPANNWVMQEDSEPLATAHGSLNDYDRDVPVLLLPYGRTQHAPDSAPRDEIGLEEVALLVTAWLGIDPP